MKTKTLWCNFVALTMLFITFFGCEKEDVIEDDCLEAIEVIITRECNGVPFTWFYDKNTHWFDELSGLSKGEIYLSYCGKTVKANGPHPSCTGFLPALCEFTHQQSTSSGKPLYEIEIVGRVCR